MTNPVEILEKSRRRLGLLAITQALAGGALPILLTLGIACFATPLTSYLQRTTGYTIRPEELAKAYAGMLMVAAFEALTLAWICWRRWREATDSMHVAEVIDQHVDARQEVLTFASLTRDSGVDGKRPSSELFAELYRRALKRLERFDPRREFRFDPRRPLVRTFAFSGALLTAILIIVWMLAERPGASETAAAALRQFAERASSGVSSPATSQSAEAARAVASDLENPRLPPQQKLAELESLERALKSPPQSSEASSSSAGGNASGSGNSSAQGKGTGGSGGSASGPGAGQGQGPGGKGAAANGSASNGQGEKGGKPEQQQVELQNDLSKAEAKLHEESSKATDNNSQTAQKQAPQGHGIAPQAGNNPGQKGPGGNPNGMGDEQIPDSGKLAQNQAGANSTGSSAHKDDKGTQGDTHLGDFPKAVSYERYYKLGEKGPALDIRDARYVTFRIPPSTVTKGGGGQVIADSSSPRAATPYTNVPLKQQRVAAAPDEEQLVPPRYRDLIK